MPRVRVGIIEIAMGIQRFRIVLLVAIFGYVTCQEQIQEERGSTKIGARCERDRNCIEHAFCRSQTTCLCDPYYSPTLDKTMCIATAGLSCSDDSTCRSMANACCRQGVCACKDSYMLDINNSSNCISRPTAVGDTCQRADDCRDVFGRAMCINEQCECISGHHFANETRKCVQTRRLYNSCSRDYECVGFSDQDVLECRNGECVCKEGEACNKATARAILGIPAVLLMFLLRLI